MASQQGTEETFYDAPTQPQGGDNLDPTSQQAPRGTNATHTGGLPTGQTARNDDPAYQQAPIGTTGQGGLGSGQAGVNRDVAYDQAPLGAPGNTTDVRGANTSQEAMGTQLNNKGPLVDDSFDTQVRSTKDKVVGGFKNLFSSTGHTTNTSGTGAVTNEDVPNVTEQDIHHGLNPSRSRGGVNSAADDSFQTQVRNTGAQVVGTMKGIGSALKMAGQKVQGSSNTTTSASTATPPTTTAAPHTSVTPNSAPHTAVTPNTTTSSTATGVPSSTNSADRL